MMLWDCLQTYGLILGDFAGAQPLLYCDGNGIPPGAVGGDPGGGWNSLYAHWNSPFGSGKAAIDVITAAGVLRVADYQP
jgi:hypothetical protein